ncbi:hypothetical protein ACHAXR_000139 [Thalassiosira sp. AJA248-18]
MRVSRRSASLHFTVVNHWRASSFLPPSLRLVDIHFSNASI